MDQNKNEQEVLIYTLTDEDGKETEFALLDQYEENGNLYYALVPVDEDESDEIGYVILKVEKEDGEDILVTIDDEAEFDHIADKFDEMLNDEIDYDE